MDKLLTVNKAVSQNEDSPLMDRANYHKRDFEISAPRQQASRDNDPAKADHILEALRSKPDDDELLRLLAKLSPSNTGLRIGQFDIRIPGPAAAQILQALVSTTIPDHWSLSSTVHEDTRPSGAKLRAAILRCLCSITGISSLIARLRTLTISAQSPQRIGSPDYSIQICVILSVLCAVLKPRDILLQLYADICNIYNDETKIQIAWKELCSLVASGKILSTAAEALAVDKESSKLVSTLWAGEGPSYAAWLGARICHFVSNTSPSSQNQWKAVASLTSRSLSLGYTDRLVRELYTGLLVEQSFPAQFAQLMDNLRQTEQTNVLETIFRDIQKKYFSDELLGVAESYQGSCEIVYAVSSLLSAIIGERPHLRNQVTDWVSGGQGGSIRTFGLRRAVLTTLTVCKDSTKSLLCRSLEQFGDKLYIKHAPLRSQEASTQVILLAAGCLSRLDTDMVRDVGRSSIFLNAVSNRLAATSAKARFLGMIVGMAVSRLIEGPEKAMKFDLQEMERDEARFFLNLVNLSDRFGSLEPIQVQKIEARKSGSTAEVSPVACPASKRNEGKRAISADVDATGNETVGAEDGPCERQGSDAYDSDDDPTLVRRKKPTAPAYIRDLIVYLRDTDDLDRYHLAVTSAPSLIRRKTGFGTELLENITELALVIVSLQDESKLPKFHEYRLQSMIALIVAQPSMMASWFTGILFDGDISQTQRSSILTALGLSAREVAGYGEQDAKVLSLPAIQDTTFPSKKLPPGLEALYLADESPMASLTKEISQTSLQPLAASAADAASGPNALKVRTFSSRMEVEKRRQQREAQKQKSRIKDLYKVLAESFFYPLKGRFELTMAQFSSATAPSYNPLFTASLLCLFLQTLTVVLSAAGPNSPFLPALTGETLSLLLALYSRPLADDAEILSALLSLFLLVVDLNVASGSTNEERLVTDFATQVLELRDWAAEVFDRTSAVRGDGEPQQQVKTLSAGVMVNLGDIMERYQGRLVGVNYGLKY